MTTVRQVYEAMQAIAPLELAETGTIPACWWTAAAQVHRVLAALDITPEVVEEAAAKQCEMIVSHHPVIFDPLKSSARRMCRSSWCGRAFLPSVCTPIWMLPRAA